jgi:membrane dipeptidase
MKRHSFETDLSQVDYPRMVEGGLDGGFFAIYTPQGPLTDEAYFKARDDAFLRAAVIRETVARHEGAFALAATPQDAARIAGEGKRVVYMSIENSYPLGHDVTLLRSFYALGVRMAGPVHFTNNQFADSATDPGGKAWQGLSPMGRDFVAVANRLGIICDASHASDDTFDQMLDLSKTPIILSHSGCRAVHDHPRNIDDRRMKALAASGGSIQINSLSAYLIDTPAIPERREALGKLFAKLRGIDRLEPAEAAALVAETAAGLKAIDAKYPVPRASFEDFMAHMVHALDLVGPDHVGIGADWDGGGGVIGMEDCSQVWKITERLSKLGYNEASLRKIWGGNVLRLLKAAEDGRTPAPP